MNIDEAHLSYKQRKHLKKSSFAIPSRRKYPIEDKAHARDAEARASGKPEEKQVRAAVHKKFPGIGKPRKKQESVARALVDQLLEGVFPNPEHEWSKSPHHAQRPDENARAYWKYRLANSKLRDEYGKLSAATKDMSPEEREEIEALHRSLKRSADTPANESVARALVDQLLGEAADGDKERHTVRVTFDNGDSITTSINGTEKEVREYYTGKKFNVGSGGEDAMATATAVQFIESAPVAHKFLDEALGSGLQLRALGFRPVTQEDRDEWMIQPASDGSKVIRVEKDGSTAIVYSFDSSCASIYSKHSLVGGGVKSWRTTPEELAAHVTFAYPKKG